VNNLDVQRRRLGIEPFKNLPICGAKNQMGRFGGKKAARVLPDLMDSV
jgi:hypothetical protein